MQQQLITVEDREAAAFGSRVSASFGDLSGLSSTSSESVPR
jgi:hypothetical protein